MTAAAISDTRARMGRKQVNDPEETTSARFATGTMARIRAALQPKESLNAFIKAAVAAELKRRERTLPKAKEEPHPSPSQETAHHRKASKGEG